MTIFEIISTSISVIALFASIFSFVKNRKYERNKKTVNFISQIRADNRYIKSLKIIKNLKTKESFLELIEQNKSSNKKFKKKYKNIRYILNFYERMAIAIKNKTYNESLIKDSLCTTVCLIYERAELLIKEIRCTQSTAYINFENLVKKWNSQMTNTDAERNKEKNEIKNNKLFVDGAFLLFLITINGYFIAYEYELINALYIGFSIEFIKITSEILIKSNLLVFFMIATTSFFAMSEKIIDLLELIKDKNFWFMFGFKLFVGGLLVYYHLYYVALALLLSSLVIYYVTLMLPILKNLSLRNIILRSLWSFLILLLMIPTMYFFVKDNSNNYQKFKYNENDYILLRNYNDDIVALQVNKDDKNDCFNDDPNKRIFLYLSKSNLNNGLLLSEISICTTK